MTDTVTPLSDYAYSCDGGICDVARNSLYPATDEYNSATGDNCTQIAGSEAIQSVAYVTDVCMKNGGSNNYVKVTCSNGDGARENYLDSECTMANGTETMDDPCLEGDDNVWRIFVATCEDGDESVAIRIGGNLILMVFSVVYGAYFML